MNCAPLDPWDPRHMASFDPPIKHLSFHCHLRKLTSGVDRGKFLHLEDLRCKIRGDCLDHPPWPAGICTKCQPSAVTLSRQVCAPLTVPARALLTSPSRPIAMWITSCLIILASWTVSWTAGDTVGDRELACYWGDTQSMRMCLLGSEL